jgi:cytochrome c oxidase subunit I+III
MTPLRRHRELQRLWGAPGGLRGSLTAVNHTRIGLRFIVTAFVFFAIGGLLAMLIRAQLAGSGTAFLDAELYGQVFTMHGTVMMFLFAIPLVEGFALYMLPKLLGSRDLAFPRLSAFGYWCYLFGGLILLAALAVGAAPDAGWFMYTPLSSKPWSPGINSDVWLLGVTFVEISAICAAVEFMTTVLKVRAAGMSLDRMPILGWYLWVTSAMMLFGFPPLILGSILLEVERAFGFPFFDSSRGGDPLLWQHLFWLFGHPEVYIIFLPAAGIVSTVLPVFAGRPLVGYAWVVASLVALGFLSFGLWVHHMFATGLPHLSLALFSAASMLVVIPTAVQIFAWLATLVGGRPRASLPMWYVYGFLFVFVAGGLTGVMVAAVPFDWQAHDTHFVVAHLHYVLIGGFVFPVLAGLYYWLPHATGARTNDALGRAAFWAIFAGVNLTFAPMHLTGLLGMPRRVFTYAPGLGWDEFNLVSSIGGFVLTIGFALVLIDLVVHVRHASKAPRDPWAAGSLEWAMPTPPTNYNFASLPVIERRNDPADARALGARLAAGHGLLAEPRHGWRETIGVRGTDGEPDQVILLPGPSWVPLVTALATGVVFLGLLFKVYAVSMAALAAVVACAWFWASENGLREDPRPVPLGDGRMAMPHPGVHSSPNWWGLVFTLLANGTLYASLVFGQVFLWVAAPGWPPPRLLPAEPMLPLATLAALVAAVACAARGRASNAVGSRAAAERWLAGAAFASLAATGGFVVTALCAPSPHEHAYGSTVVALGGYSALQSAIGSLYALYAWSRSRRGWVSAVRAAEPRATFAWTGYACASGTVSLVALWLPPWTSAP